MEGSFYRLLDELFPRLKSDHVSEESLRDTMGDIGEELRHILYHVQNSRFYDYIDGSHE